MSLKILVAVIAMLFVFAQPALATVIIGADSATTTFVPLGGFSESKLGGLIDQTGLVPLLPKYESGVTPYADFLSGPPPKSHSAILPGNGYRGSGVVGMFAFALSEIFALTDIVIWNGSNFGINAFDVWVSTTNDLTSATFVDSINADPTKSLKAQSFAFPNTHQAAFVWLDVKSGFRSNSIALGEVAFGGIGATVPEVVPEPASAALLGLGLLGFGFRRRPGHRQ